MASLQKQSDACLFTDYYEKYVTYPPKGPLPLLTNAFKGTPNFEGITEKCATWDDIYEAALETNPNFNMYRVLDVWPVLWDVLGFPGSFYNVQVRPRLCPPSFFTPINRIPFGFVQSPIYFARKDVQDAIHAPHIDWEECSAESVYVNGTDTSIPSMLSVMPNVIEKNLRTVVMHGGADYVLIMEGTRYVSFLLVEGKSIDLFGVFLGSLSSTLVRVVALQATESPTHQLFCCVAAFI